MHVYTRTGLTLGVGCHSSAMSSSSSSVRPCCSGSSWQASPLPCGAEQQTVSAGAAIQEDSKGCNMPAWPYL